MARNMTMSVPGSASSRENTWLEHRCSPEELRQVVNIREVEYLSDGSIYRVSVRRTATQDTGSPGSALPARPSFENRMRRPALWTRWNPPSPGVFGSPQATAGPIAKTQKTSNPDRHPPGSAYRRPFRPSSRRPRPSSFPDNPRTLPTGHSRSAALDFPACL